MPNPDSWEEWEGRTVVGNDGQRVGRISQVYLDHETGAPTWGSVHTGLFGARQAFVPLQAGQWQGGAFQVPYPAQLCKDAPHFDEDAELTHSDQRRLFEHYGIGAERRAEGAGRGRVGAEQGAREAPGSGDAGQSMIRSEERARVGVVRSPGESVRLRKTIVTEPVSQTVTVRREELRIEREPITPGTMSEPSGALQLREEVHELTLMHEEPVLEKTVVPVERVRLDSTVSEAQRQVRGEIRTEQIDIERRPHD